jgi:hypothetical protein
MGADFAVEACYTLGSEGYVSMLETYTLRRKSLMNRRDTRTVRPVV